MRKNVIKALLCLGLASSVGLSGCAGAGSSSLLGNQSPPYTSFYMLEGDRLVLEHLRGKNVVVLFWANSCNQSHTVVNELNAYAKRNASRKDIVFLAVSIDKAEDLPKLQDRITYGKLDGLQHSYSGNGVYDEAKVAFGVDSLPALFVLDPNGKVVAAGTSLSVVQRVLGE
jgi:hypothetical protein